MGNSTNKLNTNWVDAEIEKRQTEQCLRQFCARRGYVWRRPRQTGDNLNNCQQVGKGVLRLTVKNDLEGRPKSTLAKVQNTDKPRWMPKMKNLYPDLTEFY
jgi:hypothetical protein